MPFTISDIILERILYLLSQIDWAIVLKIILWVGIPYFLIWFFGFFYSFLKSKIWWDEGFFLNKIKRQIKNNIPIHYNEGFDRYEMFYRGFYFCKFTFSKRDNDCKIVIEGNRVGVLFGLFGDSEINLNLDKEFDYNFYKNICEHCKDKPVKKETDYTIKWLKEAIEKYGSYKGN